VTRTSGGAVRCRHDDPNAVVKFDALDDFEQLVFARKPAPCSGYCRDELEDHELRGVLRVRWTPEMGSSELMILLANHFRQIVEGQAGKCLLA
jgi:hypothetical protein